MTLSELITINEDLLFKKLEALPRTTSIARTTPAEVAPCAAIIATQTTVSTTAAAARNHSRQLNQTSTVLVSL